MIWCWLLLCGFDVFADELLVCMFCWCCWNGGYFMLFTCCSTVFLLVYTLRLVGLINVLVALCGSLLFCLLVWLAWVWVFSDELGGWFCGVFKVGVVFAIRFVCLILYSCWAWLWLFCLFWLKLDNFVCSWIVIFVFEFYLLIYFCDAWRLVLMFDCFVNLLLFWFYFRLFCFVFLFGCLCWSLSFVCFAFESCELLVNLFGILGFYRCFIAFDFCVSLFLLWFGFKYCFVMPRLVFGSSVTDDYFDCVLICSFAVLCWFDYDLILCLTNLQLRLFCDLFDLFCFVVLFAWMF